MKLTVAPPENGRKQKRPVWEENRYGRSGEMIRGARLVCVPGTAHESTKIGRFNCIFSHTICHYCTAAYVSLYGLGER